MASTGRTDAHGHDGHYDVHQHAQNPEVAHETSDISVRGVVWFVVILAVTAAVIHGSMYVLFRVLDRYEASNDPFVTPLAASVGKDPQRFPAPSLQTTPWSDLQKFRRDEDDYLRSYGWVDQKGGVAHLPIDKAKDLLLQRGLPARQGQADPSEGTDFAVYGESSGGRLIPAGGPDTSTPQSGGVSPQPGNSGTGASATPMGVGPATTPGAPGQSTATPRKPGGGL